MATAQRRRFQRVLCPVDFSRHSRAALRYAAAIAARHQGELTVLHVNDPLLSTAAAAAAYDTKALAARTHAELRALVRRTLGTSALPVTILTGHGRPSEEILRIARKQRSDLVVLGARGLTNVGKWFYGSTTEQTLRATAVPVLVVPPVAGRRLDTAAMTAWPGRRVVVPIDLDDFAIADLRAAIDVVSSFEARPLLLHVVRPSRLPEWLSTESRRMDGTRVQAAKHRLASLARSLGVRDSDVEFGDPSDQIAMTVAATRAQLVVFTVVKPRRLLGPRQGSITYRVVASGVSPVLALPSSRRR